MDLLPGAPAAPGRDAAVAAPVPKTPVPVFSVEGEVAAIWADVLELDAVKPDDDFFELGGDSLSAVQILSRITRRFNYKVSEVELFTARTVRGLSQVIQQAVIGTTGDGRTLV
jgi:phthiocerol/phenolphthiocerol synthesis type-I polyketide synthase E